MVGHASSHSMWFLHFLVALIRISPSKALSSHPRRVPYNTSPIRLGSPIVLATNRDCMAFRQLSTDSTPAILLTLSILTPVIASVALDKGVYCSFIISCRYCSYPLQQISAPHVAIDRTMPVYTDLQLLGLIPEYKLLTPLRAQIIFHSMATLPF